MVSALQVEKDLLSLQVHAIKVKNSVSCVVVKKFLLFVQIIEFGLSFCSLKNSSSHSCL